MLLPGPTLAPLGFTRRTAGGGGFTPADIAGLALWLDASQIVGLSDGDPVATWADESGNSNDATQGTSGRRPTYQTGEINGLPVVRFDGADDRLVVSLANAQPYTVFFVGKAAAASGNQYFVDGATLNTGVISNGGGDTLCIAYNGSFIIAPVAMTSYRYVACVFNGASSVLSISGAATTGDLGTVGTSGMAIGANADGSDNLTGDIAEVIVYHAGLNTTDREAVEAYLAGKYGL